MIVAIASLKAPEWLEANAGTEGVSVMRSLATIIRGEQERCVQALRRYIDQSSDDNG